MRWEAAVELRCALDEETAKLPRGWAGAPMEGGRSDDEDGPDASELGDAGAEGMASQNGADAALCQAAEAGPAIGELAGLVSPFFPEPTEAFLAGSPSPAVAIALACSRCLHAHEGTQRQDSVSHVLSFASLQLGARQGTSNEASILRKLRVACGVDSQGESRCGRGCRAGPGAGAQDEASGSSCPRHASGGNPGRGRGSSQGELPGHTVHDRDPRSQGSGSVSAKGGEAWPTERPSSRPVEEAGDKPGVVGGARREAGEGAVRSSSPPGGKRPQGEGKRCELPGFLLQLEPGWVLASAVWEGVVLLERARDYGRAVELLTQLLATRCALSSFPRSFPSYG